MEETLITKETALLAKQKGCNEITHIGYFTQEDESVLKLWVDVEHTEPDCGYALTQGLLQKWLREKNCFVMVKHRIIGSVSEPIIEFTYNGDNGEWNNVWYPTYELALEQGLIECLKLLPDEK